MRLHLDSTSRLFVALPLPSRLKRTLGAWCSQAREKWEFGKWVHPEDYHVTVQFLGSCTPFQKQEVDRHLLELSRDLNSFSLRLKGLGAFGRIGQPRILWAGVDGELEMLHALQKKVAQSMEKAGFIPESRPYRPHITLAKKCLRPGFPTTSLPSIRLGEDLEECDWFVDELVLYQTHLGHTPMYEAIGRYPFAGGKE